MAAVGPLAARPLPMLARLHAAARRVPALHRLAVVSRILLALAFIPTGLVKLLGQRFTTLGVDTGPGAFFEAMYQTGVYWNAIGFGQVAAAGLLLVPATRVLGAVAFFPILVNVVLVTWSVGFGATAYVTTAMLLANLFLLAWDGHRLRGLWTASPADADLERPPAMPRVERAGYALGLVAGLVFFLGTRDLGVPAPVAAAGLAGSVVAAGLVAVGWVVAARRASA